MHFKYHDIAEFVAAREITFTTDIKENIHIKGTVLLCFTMNVLLFILSEQGYLLIIF